MGVPAMVKWVKNLTEGVHNMVFWKQIHLGTMRFRVQSRACLHGLRIWHCRELWCRLQRQLESDVAVAVAIGPLAWEPPHGESAALKSKKKKKKNPTAAA